MPDELLIIGISGVTCGGKTTLACKLNQILPRSKLISQDDYFREVDDPKHEWIPELNHINFDILSSLDMEKMYDDIQKLISDKKLIDIPKFKNKKFQNIHDTDDLKALTYEIVKSAKLQVMIIEGFSIFNYKPLLPLFHLKYYFTLSKEECFRRRQLRVYEPPDCPGYFDKCAWPEHIKQLTEVQNEVPNVRYFTEHTENALEEVLGDIIKVIEPQVTI